MVQRLLDGDGSESRLGGVQEWPSRRRQPYSLYFLGSAPAQALVYRIVLAIDGQQWLALSLCLRRKQFSGRPQAFLIGQTYSLTPPAHLLSSFQASHAYDRAH